MVTFTDIPREWLISIWARRVGSNVLSVCRSRLRWGGLASRLKASIPRWNLACRVSLCLLLQQLIVQTIAIHVEAFTVLGNKVTGQDRKLEWEKGRMVQQQTQCALGLRGGQ